MATPYNKIYRIFRFYHINAINFTHSILNNTLDFDLRSSKQRCGFKQQVINRFQCFQHQYFGAGGGVYCNGESDQWLELRLLRKHHRDAIQAQPLPLGSTSFPFAGTLIHVWGHQPHKTLALRLKGLEWNSVLQPGKSIHYWYRLLREQIMLRINHGGPAAMVKNQILPMDQKSNFPHPH